MPRGYKVRSDGRDFMFTPGKNGSLQSLETQPRGPLLQPIQKKAKIIGPKPFADTSFLSVVAKKRNKAPTIVGAPRG